MLSYYTYIDTYANTTANNIFSNTHLDEDEDDEDWFLLSTYNILFMYKKKLTITMIMFYPTYENCI